METNELLLSIGRLYVEAARLQAVAQQLQEQCAAKDVVIAELQEKLQPIPNVTQPQQVQVANMPPELVAAAVPRDGSLPRDGR